MAYQTPITIKTVIDKIRKRHYVLPSIQREFVWDTNQIETLFDSLMRDYPISTFLFWRVEKERIKDFQFYEFLRDYHEKERRHNRKADLGSDEDVIALLDGQQRMTSLYVALAGTYAKKAPYYSWDSPNGFPTKRLYLNLLRPSESLEREFDFRFLTEDEVKDISSLDNEQREGAQPCFWFDCQKILQITDLSKVSMFLMKSGLMDTSKYSEKQSEFAINTLNEFFNVVHQKGTISYYLEEGEELDKVLQIFIRINSGGTRLSYSDLLLSIATAQWQERDAREVIHDFVDKINQIGTGFAFNKDIVLKACLVLSDFDVKFMVDNFTKENMTVIERDWDKISRVVRTAVELIAKFGYNRNNLRATNAIIPIAYFILKNGFESTILHASDRELDRRAIKEWLARSLLKGVFGGQPDSLYPKMRDLVNHNLGKFPLAEIIDYYKGRRKSITFSEDDINGLLDHQYGHIQTFSSLSLLYPGLNHNFHYHQDHIHPKSFFKKTYLKKLGFEDEKIQAFQERFNSLANLQLMQETTNREKSDTSFKEWLETNYPSSTERAAYLKQNHIDPDVSHEFSDFVEFSDRRKEALRREFISILNVTESESS